MTARLRTVLLVPVVLCLVSAFVFLPLMAGNQEKSSGVTLLQFTCDTQQFGAFNGPGSITVTGSGACLGGSPAVIATPLPSGTISNMRVAIAGDTTDSTPIALNVEIFKNNSVHPLLTCNANLAQSVGGATCQDLTHSASINAGDSLTAQVTIPDGNTFVASVAISVEENILKDR